VSEDIDSKKQRAATISQGILMMFGCCNETLREKKKSLFRYISVPNFFKSPSGTRASLPVLVDTGCDYREERPTFQAEVRGLKLTFICDFIFVFLLCI
jgi:hypothetical protein